MKKLKYFALLVVSIFVFAGVTNAEDRKVTINFKDQGKVIVPAGTTINGLSKLTHPIATAESLMNLTNKIFVKFVDSEENEVGLDTPIYSDIVLKAMYNVKVTIDDTEYEVPEGTLLKDLESKVPTKEGYVFDYFKDADGNKATDESVVHGAKLTTVYKAKETPITVTAKSDVQNPNTSDKLYLWGALFMLGIVGCGYAYKKLEK